MRMKLQDIKQELGVSTLALNKTSDPEWVACFLNDSRTSILMPTDVVEALSKDSDLNLVLVPKGTRTSKKSKSDYSLFLILEEKADYIL